MKIKEKKSSKQCCMTVFFLLYSIEIYIKTCLTSVLNGVETMVWTHLVNVTYFWYMTLSNMVNQCRYERPLSVVHDSGCLVLQFASDKVYTRNTNEMWVRRARVKSNERRKKKEKRIISSSIGVTLKITITSVESWALNIFSCPFWNKFREIGAIQPHLLHCRYICGKFVFSSFTAPFWQNTRTHVDILFDFGFSLNSHFAHFDFSYRWYIWM